MFVANEMGCERCRHSGHLGRLAIYEVVLVTPKIEELIMHKATSAQLKAAALSEGFIAMRDYGWQKVLQGETSVEEVLAATTVELEASA